jgi:hypothetical protein
MAMVGLLTAAACGGGPSSSPRPTPLPPSPALSTIACLTTLEPDGAQVLPFRPYGGSAAVPAGWHLGLLDGLIGSWSANSPDGLASVQVSADRILPGMDEWSGWLRREPTTVQLADGSDEGFVGVPPGDGDQLAIAAERQIDQTIFRVWAASPAPCFGQSQGVLRSLLRSIQLPASPLPPLPSIPEVDMAG